MTSRILLLTGMTPDRRIFERLLPLLPTAVVIDWIRPARYKSICSYAKRLSQSIPRDSSTVICGVSFGGIVARELANCMNAQTCVLVSSVRSPCELPPWFRIFRLLAPSPDVDRIPVIQIHGDRDTTFPIQYTGADTTIHGGGHILPLTHSQELAKKLAQIAA